MMGGVYVRHLLCAVLALSVPLVGLAGERRSSSVKREFQKTNPCPSTGKVKGACPGYVKDHIKPLACGGADSIENMQWQTKEAAREKDKWERKECQAKK